MNKSMYNISNKSIHSIENPKWLFFLFKLKKKNLSNFYLRKLKKKSKEKKKFRVYLMFFFFAISKIKPYWFESNRNQEKADQQVEGGDSAPLASYCIYSQNKF